VVGDIPVTRLISVTFLREARPDGGVGERFLFHEKFLYLALTGERKTENGEEPGNRRAVFR